MRAHKKLSISQSIIQINIRDTEYRSWYFGPHLLAQVEPGRFKATSLPKFMQDICNISHRATVRAPRGSASAASRWLTDLQYLLIRSGTLSYRRCFSRVFCRTNERWGHVINLFVNSAGLPRALTWTQTLLSQNVRYYHLKARQAHKGQKGILPFEKSNLKTSSMLDIGLKLNSSQTKVYKLSCLVRRRLGAHNIHINRFRNKIQMKANSTELNLKYHST